MNDNATVTVMGQQDWATLIDDATPALVNNLYAVSSDDEVLAVDLPEDTACGNAQEKLSHALTFCAGEAIVCLGVGSIGGKRAPLVIMAASEDARMVAMAMVEAMSDLRLVGDRFVAFDPALPDADFAQGEYYAFFDGPKRAPAVVEADPMQVAA